MTKMPEKIYAYPNNNGFEGYGSYNPRMIGFTEEPYHNTQQLIEKADDMKHSKSAENNGLYCAGYNQAIDDVIKMLSD